MAKVYDAQGEADKAARRICREAYAHGGTVPYTLGRLIELKLSLKVIRAIYRAKLAAKFDQLSRPEKEPK
jgi:hypothetical protein